MYVVQSAVLLSYAVRPCVCLSVCPSVYSDSISESLAYIFAADSMGLSSFKLCGGLRKTHLFCNRVHISRSRSSKVVDFGTNRNGVCDFILVINSNFGHILHRFWDTASYWLKRGEEAEKLRRPLPFCSTDCQNHSISAILRDLCPQ